MVRGTGTHLGAGGNEENVKKPRDPRTGFPGTRFRGGGGAQEGSDVEDKKWGSVLDGCGGMCMGFSSPN